MIIIFNYDHNSHQLQSANQPVRKKRRLFIGMIVAFIEFPMYLFQAKFDHGNETDYHDEEHTTGEQFKIK